MARRKSRRIVGKRSVTNHDQSMADPNTDNLELPVYDGLVQEGHDLSIVSQEINHSQSYNKYIDKYNNLVTQNDGDILENFSIIGNVDIITFGGLIGWVKPLEDDYPVIELRREKTVIGSVLADQGRDDLKDIGGIGFFIDTQDYIMDHTDGYDLYVDGLHWAPLKEFKNASLGYDQPLLINNGKVITGVIKKNIPFLDNP